MKFGRFVKFGKFRRMGAIEFGPRAQFAYVSTLATLTYYKAQRKPTGNGIGSFLIETPKTTTNPKPSQRFKKR